MSTETQGPTGRDRFAALLAELGPAECAELGRLMARLMIQASATRALNPAGVRLTDEEAADVRAGLRVRSTRRGG